MILSRAMTRFGLIAAALALIITLALAIAGSARAEALPPVMSLDEARYAKSQDMLNLSPQVKSLRGYGLDQVSQRNIDEPISDDRQPAADQNQNPFGILTGAVVLLAVFGAICTSRVLQSARRFGWDISSIAKGRVIKLPTHLSPRN